MLETCPEDMEFFQERVNNQVMVNARKIVDEKFERITFMGKELKKTWKKKLN